MNSLAMLNRESSRIGKPKAAVAIIRSIGPTESILLLRRARNTQDPWSGHFAFPGGRREKEDQTIYDTCLREVCEETGISLSPESLERVLEPAYAGRNVKAPVLVQPYLFTLASQPEVIVEAAEIENFLWINTDSFRDRNRHIETEALPGRFRAAFPLGDYYVWGFTYYLLCSVLGLAAE